MAAMSALHLLAPAADNAFTSVIRHCVPAFIRTTGPGNIGFPLYQ